MSALPPSPSLVSMPSTRRSILFLLKKRGEAGTAELAGELGITVSGIRQHLAGLVSAGLVVPRRERHGPGRPPQRYSLAAAGDALFPRFYSELTNELLAYVEDQDPSMRRSSSGGAGDGWSRPWEDGGEPFDGRVTR